MRNYHHACISFSQSSAGSGESRQHVHNSYIFGTTLPFAHRPKSICIDVVATQSKNNRVAKFNHLATQFTSMQCTLPL